MKAFFRFFLIGAAVCLLVLAGLCFLPQSRYIRWQATRTEAYARLGWVYERIHYDQTPIDVAFIGTSHTMNGVDGSAVARGINAGRSGGSCVTVTNFSIPSYGRNLHWELAKELLTHRKVKLLVLEVFENETRKAHPLFVNVADARDIVGAPLIINLNYFHDLVRLPFRQTQLSVKSLMPTEYGLKAHFSMADYDGSDVDNTRVVNVGGVEVTPHRDAAVALDVLNAAADERHRSKNTHMLGARFDSLEYNFPRHYLNGILDLAKANGTQVRLLYLPGYAQPSQPAAEPLYAGYPMIFVNDILQPPANWFDVDHLNSGGAAQLSQRLGVVLASAPELGAPNGANGMSCANGVPARTSLTPFERP